MQKIPRPGKKVNIGIRRGLRENVKRRPHRFHDSLPREPCAELHVAHGGGDCCDLPCISCIDVISVPLLPKEARRRQTVRTEGRSLRSLHRWSGSSSTRHSMGSRLNPENRRHYNPPRHTYWLSPYLKRQFRLLFFENKVENKKSNIIQ